MKTVVLGEPPPEITALLARRRALGQDRFDEVWEGDYHVVPGPHPWHGYVAKALGSLLDPLAVTAGLVATGQFNLGPSKDDFRVPDGGYHLSLPSEMFVPTAAVVVEVLSPGDETWLKFDFYARHGVDEIVIADPRAREVRWFTLTGAAYEETGASNLLGVGAADLVARIAWPG